MNEYGKLTFGMQSVSEIVNKIVKIYKEKGKVKRKDVREILSLTSWPQDNGSGQEVFPYDRMMKYLAECRLSGTTPNWLAIRKMAL